MLAEDTFTVVPHDAGTPHDYIGVKATNPNGSVDMIFTLDQLSGGIANIEDTIAVAQAQLADWQAMQTKVEATINA